MASSPKWLALVVLCMMATAVMSSPSSFDALAKSKLPVQHKKAVYQHLNTTWYSPQHKKAITGAEQVAGLVPQDTILWQGDPPPLYTISISQISIMGGYIGTITGAGFKDQQFQDCTAWNSECGLWFRWGSVDNEPNNKWPNIINDGYATSYVPTWPGVYDYDGTNWAEWKTDQPIWMCSMLWSPYWSDGISACVSQWNDPFPVFSWNNPVITGVTPTLWCNNGKTRLTITGQYWGPDTHYYTYTSVKTNEVTSPNFVSWTDTVVVSGNLPAQSPNVLGPISSVFVAWGQGPYVELPNAGQYSPSASGC